MKIVVKCAGWKDEHDIDKSCFHGNEDDNLYYEAMIRSLEKRKGNKTPCKVSAIFMCYPKWRRRHIGEHRLYNTYYVLIRARMYKQAENLRQMFLSLVGIDLRKEDKCSKK